MAETLCEWCGSPLPAGARFCPTCGAAVSALDGDPAAAFTAPVIDVTERKVVTVLFADLARSTELANALDAERFREVQSTFFGMVSRELVALRGRPEKFAGDAVMAVFGFPHAHEDDALRAVRAGLTIRDRTASLGETLGLPVPLRVRVGVNSGPVATGRLISGAGPSDRPLVSGSAVNMAARLQQAADPDEILVGETTWQLTRHTVEYGERREVLAKGFQGTVHAWPAKALSTRSSRRTIPLVGRDRELVLLQGAFERARDASRAHLVTVLGEPGIGKSRLVDELVVSLPEGTRVLAGRTGDFEEEVTYAPLAEMLRRELGLERDAPLPDLRRRLQEVVQECCKPSDSERVAARLGLAMGITPDESSAEGAWEARLDRLQEHLSEEGTEANRYRAAQIRAGMLAFVEGLSHQGPVVAVFEDLHLAQPPLLDLIDQVLVGARRLPLLVVGVARDSLLENRPGWGSHPDAMTLRLEALSEREAKELARAAGESLDDLTTDRIAAAAGGNPFFIVETTGMLLDEHAEHLSGAPHSHLLPPTVQAVVASRIDHLPPDARDLLRTASVFTSGTFKESELELLAEPREELLRQLEGAELLVRDANRPASWRFRHEMLREVAYDSLPKRERQRLHTLIVDELTRAGTAERYPYTVAVHLEQAARAALDMDPTDRTIADRAVKALARAADQARWRIESRNAIDLYERALALALPEDQWGRREARILSSIGEASYWLGEFEPAAASLSRALEIGAEDPWTVTHASRFLGDIELNVRGNTDRAEELFGRALEGARELDDPHAEARSRLMAGWVPYWRDDVEGARRMFEEALEIARANPGGDRWAEARALTSLTSVIAPVGDEREALELADQALALGREMDDPFTTAVAQQSRGNSLRRMWRLDEAVSSLDEATATFRDLGARWEVASALSDRGVLQRLRGSLEQAEADLRESVRLCRQIGERNLITWTLERLVAVLVHRRELAQAREIIAEAATWMDPENESSRRALVGSEHLVALAEGDRGTAERTGRTLLEHPGTMHLRNELASLQWWLGRILGPEEVGGEDVMEQARRTLEAAHWEQMLREPDLFEQNVLRRIGRPGALSAARRESEAAEAG